MRNRIREELELRGMTQKQLAQGIGMSEIGLSKALDGSATKATIDKIANYFGVEPSTLIVKAPVFKIKYRGELHLGDFTIPCYVLEDGRRVLSSRGMQLALNMVDEENRTSARLLRYLNQESLKPFIYKDKEVGHFEPLECFDGNSKINGYEASVLVDICDAFLEARNSINLSPRQAIIAEQCEILVRSFAKVGLIALIDEATGFKHAKECAKDELQKFLAKFLNEEASKWVKRFPDSFFEMVYRIQGWNWENINAKPGYVGRLIDDWVYQRLAPSVRDELRKRNPINENGNRSYKHHQFLAEVGTEALARHLEGLRVLAISTGYNKAHFLDMLGKIYPRPNEQFTFDFGDWE